MNQKCLSHFQSTICDELVTETTLVHWGHAFSSASSPSQQSGMRRRFFLRGAVEAAMEAAVEAAEEVFSWEVATSSEKLPSVHGVIRYIDT